MTKKFKEFRVSLPRTEQSQQYDDTLATVKIQIDIMQNNNHGLYAWLNEVQIYLNRARSQATELSYNQDREFYDE
ncbi:hypothetical protein MNBD_GAMMA21-2427 [hydrothermal vent metagenome]|uniref:Uncharacterized protein n=1 Tax=hydrothermal vent metagenome TaxID=652676 RepID=A0A3B1A2G8_9ZZZZ